MSDEMSFVSVTDSFDIKADIPSSAHAPGLVVIFDGRQCAYQLPAVGEAVELLRPDGVSATARVLEIKQHGEGRSFFFANRTRSDAPVGTVLSWRTAGIESGSRQRHLAK